MNEKQFYIKWDSIMNADKILYLNKLDELCLELSYDVLGCQNVSCNHTLHKIQLDKLYGHCERSEEEAPKAPPRA